MRKSYKGKFSPKNVNKYLGDPTNIVWRSLWERSVMVHLDLNTNVIGWSNEEIVIPYLSPVDNRWHRYFPDFFVRVKNKNNQIEAMVIEVKPKDQTKPPETPKRITPRYINEVKTWGVNESKWKAAEQYCLDRNWKFLVVTEDNLFPKK
jgi:hypothetical protein